MSNIQVVNLADNINAAVLKINQNFAGIEAGDIGGGLDSSEVVGVIVETVDSAYVNNLVDISPQTSSVDSADITNIVNNILDSDYFITVINQEYLEQFTINTDVSYLDSDISVNASAIFQLTSRIDATDSGLTAVVSSVDSLSLTLDQFITDGIEITPEQVTSALGGALDELTLRLDADSDKLVLEASKIVDLNTQLTALDSDTGAQIQAEADARNALSATVSLIDGKVTAQSTDITTLSSRVDSDFASINQTLQTVVDDQGNASAVYALDLDVNNRIAGIKLENNGNSSQFSINADAFKVFNGTTDVPAFKVENGDVFLDQVSINTLTVGDLQGDINVITPFSGSGYRTWGPTSAGYKLLTTIDLPANATPGIAHVPTISMAFSGIFKTDTAYIKLSMSKASTGLENYTQIQVMRQRSTSGGSSWAVIPVVGAWSAPVSEDVRFKVEVKMYGGNGTSNTSASLGGTNYWSGTVAGLVGNVSNSLTTGGSTTTTAEDANVSGTVVDTNGNTVTLTEDQLNNYDYSNVPNFNIDFR